jgi:S-adenosylmethionine:tRNA ribosyltransferase-isomerase
MSALKKRGIGITFVTLHVHLGTFAPLTEEQWKKGMLHTEEYAIPASAKRMIERAKKEKRPIIAIGTTVVRTLESASNTQKKIIRTKGSTDLFIREGYTFTMIDGLITNFHVPRSSLLMLVSAFAGRENIMDLYRDAIEKRYRLFSFGDGMLIV